MAKEKQETPAVIENASTESNDALTLTLNEREQAFAQREQALDEREQALNLREQALAEVEKVLNTREEQLNKLEESLNVQESKPEPETPHEGHKFEFRGARYQFADDAPELLLIGGEAVSQEEIAEDEELLLQLIGNHSPLIKKLAD